MTHTKKREQLLLKGRPKRHLPQMVIESQACVYCKEVITFRVLCEGCIKELSIEKPLGELIIEALKLRFFRDEIRLKLSKRRY